MTASTLPPAASSRSLALRANGLPTPRRHWSIFAIWLAMTMAVLDGVIVNIAPPTIAHEMKGTPIGAIGVINAYQLAIVMLLLPFAAAGEIFGYRRIYLGGVVLFVLASPGCSTAMNLPVQIAWRSLQGVAGAAIIAVNGALIRLTFPASQLGCGIGYNAVVVSIASAAGPTIAALVLLLATWCWLFAINIPIGLMSIAIGFRALPSSERAARPFDWRAALLNATLFPRLFFATSDLVGGEIGLHTLLAVVFGAAAGLMLLCIGRLQAEPMVPVDLLRIPRLRLSHLASILAFSGQMTGLVAPPFFLQQRFGHVVIGLLITGFPIGVAVAAPLSGRLSDRFPATWLGLIGLPLFALGYGLLAMTGRRDVAPVLGCLILAGFGMGMFHAPNNRVMMNDASRRRGGAAAGMMAVSRLLGQISGALAAALAFRIFGTGSWTPLIVAAVFGLAEATLSGMRRAPTVLADSDFRSSRS